jgi:Tfp pilus assembly protein PilO
MSFEEIRARCIRLIALLAVLAAGSWWVLRGRELRAAAEKTTAAADALHGRNAEARAAAVSMGDSALDDSIRVARERFEALQVRVPPQAAAAPASSMVHLFRQLAVASGAEVRRHEDIPAVNEAGFLTEGVRFCVVGDFHSLGSWLARVVTTPQLVQIREVSLDPVPDSLLARSTAGQLTGVGGAPPAPPCSEGEHPFQVVASVSLRWFRQAAPAPDSISRQ